MEDKYLIDTDILIDAGRGIDKANVFIEQLSKKSGLYISSVTQMEIIVGCRDKSELKKAEKFLKFFQVIAIDKEISGLAIELLTKYRLSHGLLIPDALIAATSIVENCLFATKNVRDFKFIKGLVMQSYA